MELGVQNTAVSTVLDQTTPVTMLLGSVMSAVSLDFGETHVYSHAAIHVRDHERFVIEMAEAVLYVRLDITEKNA